MKFSIKTFSSFFLFALLFSAACKKQTVVADVITYELTLKATKSLNGTSAFTEIKYTDGSKSTQTITNSGSDFSTKFVIPDGFPISFSVKGTASGGTPTALPTPTISYKVEKVTNGTTRESICDEFEASIKGANNAYTFDKLFTKTFSPTGCK
jgi:hypothetical protein